jgi:AcrR family transcriptional regulator
MHLIVDPTKENTILPRVIRAALTLFVRQGIDGTTTKEIARAAEVAEGALYRHFPSKNDLAWTLFYTHLDQFTRELSAAVAAEASTAGKIRAYVSYCLTSFEEDQELFTYLILSEHRELRKYSEILNHPGHVAVDIMAGGQKRGDLKSMDVFIGASILLGSIHRLCLAKIYGSIEAPLHDHQTTVFESLWAALKI